MDQESGVPDPAWPGCPTSWSSWVSPWVSQCTAGFWDKRTDVSRYRCPNMLRTISLVQSLHCSTRIRIVRSFAREFQLSSTAQSSDDKDMVVNSALKGDLASAKKLAADFFDSDFARARPWLELAVELGDVESSYLLGVGLKSLRDQEYENETVVEAKNRDEVISQINTAKKEARRAKKKDAGKE